MNKSAAEFPDQSSEDSTPELHYRRVTSCPFHTSTTILLAISETTQLQEVDSRELSQVTKSLLKSWTIALHVIS
jgi:hypothetical protein